jgi:hypothetical protein
MPRRRPEQEIHKGRVSPEQQAAHGEMRATGAEVGVAVGIDAALAQLEGLGPLRGQSQ